MPKPIDTRPIPYPIQAHPGAPIYLRTGNDEPLLISDASALFLAQQLTLFVLGNMQAACRAEPKVANGD
jgi:hypothetical protein